MSNNPIYLDSYTLQSDARIRLPKSAIENIGAEPGKTRFKIFYNPESQELVLKACSLDAKEDTSNNGK